MASLLAPAQRPVLGASAAARRPAAPAPRVLAPPPAAKGKKGNMMHLEVVVGDDEAPEMAVKRFRRLAGNAAVVTEAKRRRQFENTQDKAKRKLKEVRMRRSKRYQYQATTAEEAMAGAEPSPFADFFQPTADSFVGSLAVRD